MVSPNATTMAISKANATNTIIDQVWAGTMQQHHKRLPRTKTGKFSEIEGKYG